MLINFFIRRLLVATESAASRGALDWPKTFQFNNPIDTKATPIYRINETAKDKITAFGIFF